MSSKRYRERLKENDPEKYQEMLEKAKERSKRNREARKMRWTSEPQTRGLLQEIENFKEKERYAQMLTVDSKLSCVHGYLVHIAVVFVFFSFCVLFFPQETLA